MGQILAIIGTVGFGTINDDVSEGTPGGDYCRALFRDELALLGDPQRGRTVGVLE